jgi:hypothetical protein
MLPHADVHRRRGEHRLVGGEQQGGGEVVGDAGRHLREEVGGGRADQDQVGGAAELDMAHLRLVLEVPQRGVDRAFGQRGEGHGRDEMRAAGGQHGRDLMAVAAGEADQLGRLERRDAAADDEQDARHVESSSKVTARDLTSRAAWPAAMPRELLHCDRSSAPHR